MTRNPPYPPLGARSAVYRWADLPEPVREWWARADRAANAAQQTLGHADAAAAALGSNRVHVAVHCGLRFPHVTSAAASGLAAWRRRDTSGAKAVAVLDTTERRS